MLKLEIQDFTLVRLSVKLPEAAHHLSKTLAYAGECGDQILLGSRRYGGGPRERR